MVITEVTEAVPFYITGSGTFYVWGFLMSKRALWCQVIFNFLSTTLVAVSYPFDLLLCNVSDYFASFYVAL